ncbi:MAG: hypothetical protein PVJ61_05575 [Dehalococcoidia bacterium]|jgi:hypothetical protein
MSKFIDKLKAIAAGGTAPMGFRTAGTKPRPRMLLVASVAANGKAEGADAILLSVPKTGLKSARSLAKVKVPWGGWLKEVTPGALKTLGEAGADFVVFPSASVSKALLEEEKPGKIIEVEAEIEAGLLKAIDGLPVDAVLVAAEKAELSWQDLMRYRRCAAILSKPLLVTVSPDIAASELGALCEAGVAGVVAGSKIDKLRPIIDKLPTPKAKSKAGPLVPRVGGSGAVSEEDEDDED